MGIPRYRRRSLKKLIRVLLCCLIIWILYQGWSWWNRERSHSPVDNVIERKRLEETLQRIHHLCSIAKEMGHGPSFSVCKQSKYDTLNDRDIVIVSLECKNLSFEEQLMKNYEGRVTVYTYCSTASSFNRKTVLHRSKMIPVRPFFFRLDWLPYLGRHVWMKSLKQLLLQSYSSSSSIESVHFFRMGRLRGEPIVSAPNLLSDLIENGALDHVQQLHIEIDIESKRDISDWIRVLNALNKAQYSMYRSKQDSNESIYVTSWMKTIASVPTESLAKINPLDPNANFADKLQKTLTAPSVTCSRRLSIPVTPVKPTKQLDFPSLSPLRWPLCLERIKPPCLVYSAKVGGSDDFEDAVARLGCEVFLFDPSLYDNETKTQSDSNIHSFNWGLGNSNTTIVSGVKRAGEPSQSNGMWQYVKSREIVRELGHEKRTIDVLKLDVHGSEWDILENFLTSNTLTHIHQIIVSMHVWHGESVFSLIDRFMRTRKLIDAGFGIFYSEPMVDHGLQSEPQRCCHIVGWIRKNSV